MSTVSDSAAPYDSIRYMVTSKMGDQAGYSHLGLRVEYLVGLEWKTVCFVGNLATLDFTGQPFAECKNYLGSNQFQEIGKEVSLLCPKPPEGSLTARVSFVSKCNFCRNLKTSTTREVNLASSASIPLVYISFTDIVTYQGPAAVSPCPLHDGGMVEVTFEES